MTEHPGTVEWVDGDEHGGPAGRVAAGVAAVGGGARRRAAAGGADRDHRAGDEREIRQHGPDGELLRTTFGTVGT